MHRPRASTWALVAILLVAAVARCLGIGFGLPHTEARPDETRIVRLAVGMIDGEINPGYFNYPPLFMLLVAGILVAGWAAMRTAGAAAPWADFLARTQTAPASVYVLARLLSAAFGTATVWVVYVVGRRAFGRPAALLGAFYLSVCFLHVRESHFGVTDAALTFFLVTTVGLLLAAAETASWRLFAAAGTIGGLGCATKYNAVLLAIPAAVALAVLGLRAGRADRRLVLSAGSFVVAFGVALLAAFPWILTDHERVIAAIAYEARHLRIGHEHAGAVVAIQGDWMYHLRFSLRHGLGLPVAAAAACGIVAAAIRTPGRAAILFSFPAAYYGLIAGGSTAFVRYALPLVPFLCLAAGFATWGVVEWGTRRRFGRWRAVFAASLALAVAFPSLLAVARFDRLLRLADTRVLAAAFLEPRLGPATALFQSGSRYVHAFTDTDMPPREEWQFDERTRGFAYQRQPRVHPPDWIVVAESPLPLYTPVPAEVRSLVRSGCQLAVAFRGLHGTIETQAFDQQDAFFLPMTRLERVRRPGPDISIYACPPQKR